MIPSSRLLLISALTIVYLSTVALSETDSVSSTECSTNTDCHDLNAQLRSTTPHSNAVWWCVAGHCRFVVGMGEQCSSNLDCLSTHLSSDVSFANATCQPQHCSPSSFCSTPWHIHNVALAPTTSCCGGIAPVQKCVQALTTDLEVCGTGTRCQVQKEDQVGQPGEIKSGTCVEMNPKETVWIGVVITLVGGAVVNIGLNLQKYAIKRVDQRLYKERSTQLQERLSLESTSSDVTRDIDEETENAEDMKQLTLAQTLKNPFWILGFSIFLIGNLCTFVALRFAPQSLISPLGAVSLVTNAIVAPIINHEVVRRHDYIAIFFIIGGAIVATVFAGITNLENKLCVMLALFRNLGNVLFLAVTGGLIVLLWYFIVFTEWQLRRKAKRQREFDGKSGDNSMKADASNDKRMIGNPGLLADTDSPDRAGPPSTSSSLSVITLTETGLTDSSLSPRFLEMSQIPSLSSPSNNPKHDDSPPQIDSSPQIDSPPNKLRKIVLPFAYASIGGLLGSFTVLFGKILINLITESVQNKENQFTTVWSWLLILVAVAAGVSQTYWINSGLQKYDAMLQIPVFYIVWSIFDIIGGGVYFEEFQHYDVKQYVFFLSGVGLVFIGIVFLSKRLTEGR